MPPHREIFPFWHCSDLKIYKHALFEDSGYLWRGHRKCFQSSHKEAIQLILNTFFVPGIALRTLYRLSCPEMLFFFSFFLKLTCWSTLKHIIASRGSLKRKGEYSGQFVSQLITCSGRLCLVIVVFISMYLLFLIASVLCTLFRSKNWIQ